MDKFGIFNLLNSFLTPSSASEAQNSSPSQEEKPAPADLLSGLINSFSGNKDNPSPPPNDRASAPIKTASAPLQRQMLSTMKSHDELLRRINSAKTSPKG